jgi:DNA-binding winged helix-turn-helix (wHTH) protein
MQICFHFGDYSFNPETCDLFKKNRRLPIGAQVALFLAALLDSPGQIVSREKLESRLWPNQVVGLNNLNVVASQARKLFLDDPASPKFIKTVGQRGYCFIYPIDSSKDGKHPDAVAAAESYYRRGLYLCEVSAECDMQQRESQPCSCSCRTCECVYHVGYVRQDATRRGVSSRAVSGDARLAD